LNHCNIPPSRFSVVVIISAQHEAGLATKEQWFWVSRISQLKVTVLLLFSV